jgi:hypothetical protein
MKRSPIPITNQEVELLLQVKRPRCASHGETAKKTRKRPASGYFGVYPRGNRWTAQIRYVDKRNSLGSFDTKQEAALAYDRAARKCEEKKPLNYESIEAAEEAAKEAQAEYIFTHGPPQPRPRPPSGYCGVRADRKRWMAQIYYDSKGHNLGNYDTRQEAALAYDRAARQLKEKKPLNFESIEAAEEAAAEAAAEHARTHCAPQPKPPPASGYYGVTASGKRWRAQIRYGGNQCNLGTFPTKLEAALAYEREARQCGEKKPLNYESIEAAEEAVARAKQ